MSKTKIEKIASIEEEIKQLKERQKLLQQQHNAQERKDRTKRLCSRHGLLEKYMPDLIGITDEQFEAFIKKGIDTSYGRNILAEIKSKSGIIHAPQTAKSAAQPNPTPVAKPAETAQDGGTGGNAEQGNSTRASG